MTSSSTQALSWKTTATRLSHFVYCRNSNLTILDIYISTEFFVCVRIANSIHMNKVLILSMEVLILQDHCRVSEVFGIYGFMHRSVNKLINRVDGNLDSHEQRTLLSYQCQSSIHPHSPYSPKQRCYNLESLIPWNEYHRTNNCKCNRSFSA